MRFLALVLTVCSMGCASGWKTPALPWQTAQEPPSAADMLGAPRARTSVGAFNTQRSAPASAQADAGKPAASKKLTKQEQAAQQAAAIDYVEQMAAAKGLEEKHKLDEARRIYQQLIVQHPERAEPYHRLGVVADRQKRHREAQNLYTQALQRKPLDPEALNNLGYSFFLQGKLDKAESALTKAVSLAPSDRRYRNNLGLVLGHKRDDEAALEQFRHAGSEADSQYNLAFIQLTRGDEAQAERRLQLALLSDPNHQAALAALKTQQSPTRLLEAKAEVQLASGEREVTDDGMFEVLPGPVNARR